MPSLAHEGNPKEAEIVISGGSVLSTAQLDIDFQFFAGDVNPTVPSTYDPGLTQRVQSCPDVFSWRNMEDGADLMYMLETSASGSARDDFNDLTFDLTIHSSPNCYGLVWEKWYPLHISNPFSTAGTSVYFITELTDLIDTPRAGPAIWIADTNPDEDHVTVYAALINVEAGVTQLVKYSNASLSEVGTVLGTCALPSVGGGIYLKAYQHPTETNYFYVAIYDSTWGILEASINVAMDDINNSLYSKARHSKMNFGFISVGGSTSGTMTFRANPTSPVYWIPNLQAYNLVS